jgi:putative lipoic acid-binding regulatory protein
MNDINGTECALQFPCRFPIKAVGISGVKLDLLVAEIVRRHVSDIHEGAITRRPSKGGKYTSVTVVVEATGREQLDNIYRDLSACPQVIMAL